MEKGAKLSEDEGETAAPAALDGVVGEDLADAGDAVVDSLTGSLGHLRSASLTTKAVMAPRTDAQPTAYTLDPPFLFDIFYIIIIF